MTVIFKHFKRFKSAWASGLPSARWAIIRKLITPVSNIFDILLSGLLSYRTGRGNKNWIILCGSPRSGSTVIYQVLTRVIDCNYVTNLHQVLPRTASFFLLKYGRYFSIPKNLTSYYGHTQEWLNVNEGNELIQYWFKTDDTEGVRERVLKTMEWISCGSNKAVFIKNIGLYNRLYQLHKAVPEFIFVRIERDKQQVIESELKGYYDLGYFNPIPDELKNTEVIDPVAFAVAQVESIERKIESELDSVPEERVVHCSYEGFCENPFSIIEKLKSKMKLDVYPDRLKDKLVISGGEKVSQEDRRKIMRML